MELSAEIEKHAADVIHLVVSERQVFTKIGGRPSGKSGCFAWPTWKDRSLAFVMQIKLSEIPMISQMGPYPNEGMLYVFYDQEQSTWGFDPNDRGSWRILFGPEDDDADEIPFPDDVDEDYRYPEVRLEPRVIKAYPNCDDAGVFGPEWSEEDYEQYSELAEGVFGSQPKHQIGGFPQAIQSNAELMAIQCESASNGIYCGDGSCYNSPEGRRIAARGTDWMLLLQIDSETEGANMWGDCGMLYFWIRKEDLAKRSFENVWMILECC